MNETLHLQMSLLRGETPCPIDIQAFGRSASLRLSIQKKGALSDRIAMDLLALIAVGRLAPGTRLPPERRMADALNASRVCVRSALERLKQGGYLTAVQGSGTRVASDGQAIAELTRANRQNFDDLGAFCAFLDAQMLRQAMSIAPDRAALARRIRDLLEAGPGPSDRAATEIALRVTLAKATGSQVYTLLIESLERGFRNYFQAMAASGLHAATRSHIACLDELLVETIRNGDPAGAVRAMEARSVLIRSTLAQGPAVPRTTGDDDQLLRDLETRQPETLRDTVAREIARMIATGQLEPGDRLLSERRLADLYGISRVSVREALAKLKADGVVISSERFGTKASADHLAEDLADAAGTSLSSFSDLCGVRHYLEVWAARRAASRASEDDLRDLRRILAEMRRPTHSPQRMIDLDLNLHLTIARAAGSALHLFVAEVLRSLVTGYFNHSLTDPTIAGGRGALLLIQHEEIVQAILSRDPEGAAAAMDRHVRSFQRSYDSGRAIEAVINSETVGTLH